MSQTDNGTRTFTANGALLAGMRVKVTSASATIPPQVEVAGSGEQHHGVVIYDAADTAMVAVRLRTGGGTVEAIASEAFTVGATLYGAAAGKVKDTSAGSAIGVALEAATADGDIVEIMEQAVLSTTDATVSFSDTNNQTTAATVKAALEEIYQNAINAQGFIGVPLTQLRETSTMNVGNAAANGGLLASDTTPVLSAINGATSGSQRVLWAASNNDEVMFQVALPPDFDSTGDVTLHVRIASAGTTNAVGFSVASYWGEGDTVITDTTTTNQTTAYVEKTATIALADLHDVDTVTIGLTPVAHTTDTMALSAVWLTYTKKLVA